MKALKYCYRHGPLSKSALYPDGRCRQCCKEDNCRYSKRRKTKHLVSKRRDLHQLATSYIMKHRAGFGRVTQKEIDRAIGKVVKALAEIVPGEREVKGGEKDGQIYRNMRTRTTL
jgi:hypothetical protein